MITISPQPLDVWQQDSFEVTITSDVPGQIVYCIGEGPLVPTFELANGGDYEYHSEGPMPEVVQVMRQKFGPWIQYRDPITVQTLQSVKAALIWQP